MDSEIEDKLNKFFTDFKLLNFKKGEVIIRANDVPSGVFYLKSGYVKMNSIFENGSELTLNIFKPGSFFPMVWAIGDVENTYFFQAMSNSLVYKSSKKDVLDFIKGNPDILFDLTRRILVGLDGLLTNVSYLLFGSAYNRVASAILISAKRFGQKNGSRRILIDIRLTHQDIANLSGLTRETASIALGRLEKDGIISQVEHKFVVNDIKKLQENIFISVKDEGIASTL